MSFALPAFFTFLLILPGFVFVASYYTVGSSRLRAPALGARTALAISVSIVLHLVWGWLVDKYSPNYQIDYALAFGVLSAKYDESLLAALTPDYIFKIGMYFISLYVTATGLGALVRQAVVSFNLDRKSFTERLRFTSDFAYIALGRDFTAKLNEESFWQRVKANCRISDSQYVGAELLVEIGEKLVYFTGVLNRVDYSNDGEPKRLYLSSVMSCELESFKSLSENIDSQHQSGSYYIFNIADLKLLGLNYFDD